MKTFLQTIAFVAVALATIAGCSQGGTERPTPVVSHPPKAATATPHARSPEEGSLEATIQAIDLEMKRYRGWIKGTKDAAQKAQYEARLRDLESEREKYARMSPSEYRLPKKVELTGWFENGCAINSLVHFEGETRSGPFYHVAGVSGPGCSAMRPKVRYRMTMYLVHRRDYPFPDHYVYIADFEEVR